MSDEEPQIIACIDGAPLTEAVCDYAGWIAQETKAPLVLLHTINHHNESSDIADLTGSIGLGAQEQLLEELIQLEQQESKLKLQHGKALLKTTSDYLSKTGIDATCIQRHGDLIESVVALEANMRVLILGLRGQVHNEQKNKIGAKLEDIVRSLHRPILIVNGKFTKPKAIMLAYDGSEAAEKAVTMVATSPLYRDLVCHLVCVAKKDEKAAKLLTQAMQKLEASNNRTVIVAHLKGKVEQELCAYQEVNNIDLMVMGAFSHTRFRDMFLGSFTLKMLLSSKTPLLLLR